MYTNIDIDHALQVFECWLTEFPSEIPNDFPTTLFLKVLKIVMTSNVFQFGNCNGDQLGMHVCDIILCAP